MVNASLLESMAAAKTAHDVYGILDGSTAAEVAMDSIEYVWSGDYKVLVISFHDMLSLIFSSSSSLSSNQNNLEKCCIIEYCCRNGGITMTNARRFAPSFFQQRTNRCGECRLPGHQAPACNNKCKALAKRWGIS